MSDRRNGDYKQLQRDHAEVERLLAQARHGVLPLPNQSGAGHVYRPAMHGQGAGSLPADIVGQRRGQAGYQQYGAAPAVPAEKIPDVAEAEVRWNSCHACSVCSGTFRQQSHDQRAM
jgi:hypothetical protein